jgi:[acyl-carrier-protein] S-malonyltransferase
LSQTRNAQPAIYLTSLACLTAAREAGALDGSPAFVAGHSLGEYSALAAAAAYSFEDGLRLVEERGRLTQAAAEATPGRMAAILGLDEATAQSVCAEAGAELCNINAPGQIVIGGSFEAIDRACALALERGARRAVPLDVSGAFHTSLMQPAVGGMEAALNALDIKTPNPPLVANDRANTLAEVPGIRAELAFQLTHPVRWVQCVEFMTAHGVTTFIEIGPGRVLTGLIKRISPGATLRNISGAGSL